MADTVIKLTKPISAFGETVTELNLREPNGAHLLKAGFPFTMETTRNGTKYAFDTVAITNLIAECAQIPRSSVGHLSAADFQPITGVIVGFFGDASPENSDADTSS
jgi:hypothetical protein